MRYVVIGNNKESIIHILDIKRHTFQQGKYYKEELIKVFKDTHYTLENKWKFLEMPK